MSKAPKSQATVPEDLPLKRNKTCAMVSGGLMQRNETYSTAASLQKNEVYEGPLPEVPLQKNTAYESVMGPAT